MDGKEVRSAEFARIKLLAAQFFPDCYDFSNNSVIFASRFQDMIRMIEVNYMVQGNVTLPRLNEAVVRDWIDRVAQNLGKRVGRLTYVFCDDEYILKTNRDFLGHDYYTDIITFDYCEDDVLNGDLVISLDTVRSNAELFHKDYDEELHRVIIHGILHLCGQNDKGPGEREQMEAAENKALALR